MIYWIYVVASYNFFRLIEEIIYALATCLYYRPYPRPAFYTSLHTIYNQFFQQFSFLFLSYYMRSFYSTAFALEETIIYLALYVFAFTSH